MPMLLSDKTEEILSWRESQELLEGLKGRLVVKWGRSTGREAEEFLAGVIAALAEEIAYEDQLDAELDLLKTAVEGAEDPASLPPLRARHVEVLAAHFSRRSSVLAVTGAVRELNDLILARCARLAELAMLRAVGGSAPIYALLASGDQGRDEATLYGECRYVLLHELDPERFDTFGEHLLRTLKEAGVVPGPDLLWQGSLEKWRRLLSEGERGREGGWGLSALPPFASAGKESPPSLEKWRWRLETVADLRFVTGFEPLGLKAEAAAAAALKEQKNRDPFFQLARQVIHLPLALGHFGRWRLEGGGHRWEIDVERLALSPMVQAVRVLAVQAGIHATGTLDRVRELLYKGWLDVDLALRLFKAFQCFMQLRIESEIKSEGAGAWVPPEEFTLEQDARIRGAVESVLNLQKIAYQKLVAEV